MSESTYPWELHPNPFVRIAGRDRPAGAVLAQALTTSAPHLRRSTSRSQSNEFDYAQVDPQLPLVETNGPVPAPTVGTGYAGLTETQRGFFYQWLHFPEQAAPPAYQRLYLAYLETHLFLGEEKAAAARSTLLDLLEMSAWSSLPELTRSTLLAGWLAQDGRYLARAITHGQIAPALMGTVLGWQALLHHPLRGDEVLAVQQSWRTTHADNLPPTAVVQLNIDSLAATLGDDPLQHALAQITPTPTSEDEAAENTSCWPGAWTTWRCAHRDLSLSLPNPDVRPALGPLLNELLQTAQIFNQVEIEASLALAAEDDEEDEAGDDGVETSSPNWHLVLEFGESRSQLYEHVVFVAQKQPNYIMLMDEGRQIVHRLLYQKRNIRQFWRIWDYVQKWSNVRVYVNGQEIEKWKIWPYSPHMR